MEAPRGCDLGTCVQKCNAIMSCNLEASLGALSGAVWRDTAILLLLYPPTARYSSEGSLTCDTPPHYFVLHASNLLQNVNAIGVCMGGIAR